MSNIRENKQQLQQQIQALGNAAASALPDNWERVVVGFFLSGEKLVTHLQFHVMTTTSDDYIDLMNASWDTDAYDGAISEIQQICKKIRSICVAARDSWMSMTFCMMADGSFNIDYDYDAIERYDPAFIMMWQSQYLT